MKEYKPFILCNFEIPFLLQPSTQNEVSKSPVLKILGLMLLCSMMLFYVIFETKMYLFIRNRRHMAVGPSSAIVPWQSRNSQEEDLGVPRRATIISFIGFIALPFLTGIPKVHHIVILEHFNIK